MAKRQRTTTGKAYPISRARGDCRLLEKHAATYQIAQRARCKHHTHMPQYATLGQDVNLALKAQHQPRAITTSRGGHGGGGAVWSPGGTASPATGKVRN